MSFKKWLVLSIALLLPVGAYAEINGNANPTQPFLNITAPNQIDGVNVNPNTAAPGNFTNLTVSGTTTFSSSQAFSGPTTFSNTTTFTSSPVFSSGPSSIDTHYAVFGNSLLQNPLTQTVFESFLTASANAGTSVILNSAAGRTVFPGAGLSILVSGTAAGATSLNLECQSSHRVFVTWPIAELVNNIPVGIYASSATVLGSALTNGCNASDAVILSANGTLSTTTQIFVNLPYTVQ